MKKNIYYFVLDFPCTNLNVIINFIMLTEKTLNLPHKRKNRSAQNNNWFVIFQFIPYSEWSSTNVSDFSKFLPSGSMTRYCWGKSCFITKIEASSLKSNIIFRKKIMTCKTYIFFSKYINNRCTSLKFVVYLYPYAIVYLKIKSGITNKSTQLVHELQLKSL